MNKRTILFYGDSNTYGYDPRIASSGRYDEDSRWTDILKHTAGDSWEILVNAMNGREIPSVGAGTEYVLGMLDVLEKEGRLDWFAVMLGTNDLFSVPINMAAGYAATKMESFLGEVQSRFPDVNILLIGPAPVGSPESSEPELRYLFHENLKMNRMYADLASMKGYTWIDAAEWNLPMSYDEVHLSEEGHRLFAEHIRRRMEGLMEPR